MARKKAGPFPSRDEVVRFIAESPTPLTKRDLVRAFQIQVEDRPRFKDLLREIEAAGEVDRGRGRRLAKPEALPSVTVVRVRSVDLAGIVQRLQHLAGIAAVRLLAQAHQGALAG